MKGMPTFSNDYNMSASVKDSLSGSASILKAQSSPGNLQVGQVPSNWTRHIPHTSSSGTSQCHVATAEYFLIVTFIFD